MAFLLPRAIHRRSAISRGLLDGVWSQTRAARVIEWHRALRCECDRHALVSLCAIVIFALICQAGNTLVGGWESIPLLGLQEIIAPLRDIYIPEIRLILYLPSYSVSSAP